MYHKRQQYNQQESHHTFYNYFYNFGFTVYMANHMTHNTIYQLNATRLGLVEIQVRNMLHKPAVSRTELHSQEQNYTGQLFVCLYDVQRHISTKRL